MERHGAVDHTSSLHPLFASRRRDPSTMQGPDGRRVLGWDFVMHACRFAFMKNSASMWLTLVGSWRLRVLNVVCWTPLLTAVDFYED